MNFIQLDSSLSLLETASETKLCTEMNNSKHHISDADFSQFLSQLEKDIWQNISGAYDPSWFPLEQQPCTEVRNQSPLWNDKELSLDMNSKFIPSFGSCKEDFVQKDDLTERASPVIQVKNNACRKFEKFDREAFWTEENQAKLMSWATKYRQNWKKIAKLFDTKGVTVSEVRNKYREIKANELPLRIRFSHEEDCLIAKYYTIYEFDWKKIAAHLPRRNHIMVKNRFYSYIKKHNLIESLLAEVQYQESNTIHLLDKRSPLYNFPN